MNEQVKEFIDAVESGSGSNASELFNELMSQKVISAIDDYRAEIAGGLFKTESVELEEDSPKKFSVYKHSNGKKTLVKVHDTHEDAKAHAKQLKDKLSHADASYYGGKSYHVKSTNEAVVPGSVNKDKDGNVVGGKTVPDDKPAKDNKDSLETLYSERPSRKMKKD